MQFGLDSMSRVSCRACVREPKRKDGGRLGPVGLLHAAVPFWTVSQPTAKAEIVSVTSRSMSVELYKIFDLCCTSSGVANLPAPMMLIWYDCDTEAQDWEKGKARWHCSVLENENHLDDRIDRKESHPQSLTCCAYVRPTGRSYALRIVNEWLLQLQTQIDDGLQQEMLARTSWCRQTGIFRFRFRFRFRCRPHLHLRLGQIHYRQYSTAASPSCF